MLQEESREIEHNRQITEERRQIDLEQVRNEKELRRTEFEYKQLKNEAKIASLRNRKDEPERIKQAHREPEKNHKCSVERVSGKSERTQETSSP